MGAGSSQPQFPVCYTRTSQQKDESKPGAGHIKEGLSGVPLTKEARTAVIEKHRINEKDTGSADVQIAMLTSRIRQLQGHLEANKQDHHSRRGLLMMVGKRRRLLNYLARENHERYRALIAELGLRR